MTPVFPSSMTSVFLGRRIQDFFINRIQAEITIRFIMRVAGAALLL
ncbi:MAG: hypothetical protein WKF97_19510 [Chitinophagaceae bacterium]